jgi:diacylglycerol kinase family enzyme
MRDRSIPIGVITNPHSKKNRTRSGRRDELQRIVGPLGLVRETRSIAEIRPVIDEFRKREVQFWVSDGGDGALHWLLNEARRSGGELPRIVPTNGGTIDFVAKRAGIRGQADEVLDRLVRAVRERSELPVEKVPTFVLRGTRVEKGGAEAPFERVGFLAAIAGIGQRFFDKYYLDPFPGPFTVLRVIAKGLASIALGARGIALIPGLPASWRAYAKELLRPQHARVKVDRRTLSGERWRALHVGAFFAEIGGIVRLFPYAGEGKLHVMAGNPSPFDVALAIPNLFRGRPMGRGIADMPAASVEVEALGEELLNPVIDGEIFRGVSRLSVEPGPAVQIPRIDGRG